MLKHFKLILGIIIIGIGCFIGTLVFNAFSSTSENDLKERLNIIESVLKQTNKEHHRKSNELEIAKKKQPKWRSVLYDKPEVNRLEEEISDLEKESSLLESYISKLKERLKKMNPPDKNVTKKNQKNEKTLLSRLWLKVKNLTYDLTR